MIGELSKPDIIIVEGFKNEKHAKIEIIKDAETERLIAKFHKKTSNINRFIWNAKFIIIGNNN